MSVLGKYWQTPNERKRYVIDYTDWLDAVPGELLSAVSFVGFSMTPIATPISSPVSLAFASTIDPAGKLVFVFISGGDDGVQYKCVVTIETLGGQIKEDEFLMNIRVV